MKVSSRSEKKYQNKLSRITSIGRYSYVSREFQIKGWGFLHSAEIHIGSFCSISSAIFNCFADHNYKRVTTFPIKMSKLTQKDYGEVDESPKGRGNIVIGNDVWIGDTAMILGGANIGSGAVIGAGAVVAKDVPPYSIFVGNPGRIIKTRFSQGQIKELLDIAWWNWTDEQIRDRIEDFYDENIDNFIKKYKK